jgi:hypothetical protein
VVAIRRRVSHKEYGQLMVSVRLYELIDGTNECQEDEEALLKKQIHMSKHDIPCDCVSRLGARDQIARVTCQAREPYDQRRMHA